jgi:hypothetical protein
LTAASVELRLAVAITFLLRFLRSKCYTQRLQKIYRAKTPRTPRKKYFSELGALCAFARGIFFSVPQVKSKRKISNIFG